MITEHDILVDAIAEDIFEDFHHVITQESRVIMEERGINQATMNIIIDAFFLHNNTTKEHKKRRENEQTKPIKQKSA